MLPDFVNDIYRFPLSNIGQLWAEYHYLAANQNEGNFKSY